MAYIAKSEKTINTIKLISLMRMKDNSSGSMSKIGMSWSKVAFFGQGQQGINYQRLLGNPRLTMNKFKLICKG